MSEKRGDALNNISVGYSHLSAALWWRGLGAAAGVRRLLSEPTNPLSVPGETIRSWSAQHNTHIIAVIIFYYTLIGYSAIIFIL